MKRWVRWTALLALALLIAGCGGSGGSSGGGLSERDRLEIENAVGRFDNALRSGSLQGIRDLFHAEVIIEQDGTRERLGQAQAVDRLESLLGLKEQGWQLDEASASIQPPITARGGAAIAHVDAQVTISRSTSGGHETRTTRKLGPWTFRRDGSAKWRVQEISY